MEDFSLSNLFSVKDLRVVIAGGGTGIGAAMAQALAYNGATVFILGRRLGPLEETAKSVSPSSDAGSITPIQCDITSKSDLEAAVAAVSAKTPFIDTLIISSGSVGPPPPFPENPSGPSLEALREALWATPMEDFTEGLHTNITAALYTTVAFLSLLNAANADSVRVDKARPRPQVIALSSVASYAKTTASGFSYNSSKAGLNLLMKQLSNTFVPYNIRVNVICPGIFLTPMTNGTVLTDMAAGGDPVADGAYPKEIVPATRIGGDKDSAGLILWLCSGSGGYLNGAVIVSDGGILSVRPSCF